MLEFYVLLAGHDRRPDRAGAAGAASRSSRCSCTRRGRAARGSSGRCAGTGWSTASPATRCSAPWPAGAGAVLAVLVTFAASGLMHEYLVLACVGWRRLPPGPDVGVFPAAGAGRAVRTRQRRRARTGRWPPHRELHLDGPDHAAVLPPPGSRRSPPSTRPAWGSPAGCCPRSSRNIGHDQRSFVVNPQKGSWLGLTLVGLLGAAVNGCDEDCGSQGPARTPVCGADLSMYEQALFTEPATPSQPIPFNACENYSWMWLKFPAAANGGEILRSYWLTGPENMEFEVNLLNDLGSLERGRRWIGRVLVDGRQVPVMAGGMSGMDFEVPHRARIGRDHPRGGRLECDSRWRPYGRRAAHVAGDGRGAT